MEVQPDEHKLSIVQTQFDPFTRVLLNAGIVRDDKLKLITQGEHLHTTAPRHAEAFRDMCYHLGVGETAGVV